MLDDFEQQHDVVALAFRRDRLGGRRLIFDVEMCGAGMGSCRLDGFGSGIDAGHVAAQSPEWLADEAAAAANIEQAQAGEAPRGFRIAGEVFADLVADIREPDWIDAVQRPERAVCVPPFGGKLAEAGNLFGIQRS